MRTRLIIVRHGETVYNLKGLFQGQIDSELTNRGKQQAICAAKRLKDENIDIVYSSPLQRAEMTANIINRDRKLDICLDERLKEIRCGEWEGHQIDDIKRMDEEEFRHWEHEPHKFTVEGAETFEQVAQRAAESLDKIISENKGKTILLVSHMVTILLMFMHLTNGSIANIWSLGKQPNAAINIVDIYEDGNIEFVVKGDNSHLTDDVVSIAEWESPNKKSPAINFA